MEILSSLGGLQRVTILVLILYFYHNSTRIVLKLCDDLMEQTTN